MFYIYLTHYSFLLHVVLEFDSRDRRLLKVKRLITFLLILRLKLFFFTFVQVVYDRFGVKFAFVCNVFYHPADPIVNNMLINMFFDFFQLIIHCNFLKDLG